MSALAIVALVLGILLVLALVLLPIRRRARRTEADVAAELGDGVRRSEQVLGLGLESRGRGQVRGNGLLALGEDELVFRMLVPRRETRIPLAGVTAVGSERTWLGKWIGVRLLRVRWRTPEGGEDAMAWRVRDLDAWIAALGGER